MTGWPAWTFDVVDDSGTAGAANAIVLDQTWEFDGFQWQPRRTLDWLVCDMVESPRKVADRMAAWFHNNWCRQAIFNLKLPMKKRWEETRICLEGFEQQTHRPMTIRARQLYHDREEITVFATPRT